MSQALEEKIVGYIEGAKRIAGDMEMGIIFKYNRTTRKEEAVEDHRIIIEIAKMLERQDK